MSVYRSHDEFIRDLKRELELIAGRELSWEYVEESAKNFETLVSDFL